MTVLLQPVTLAIAGLVEFGQGLTFMPKALAATGLLEGRAFTETIASPVARQTLGHGRIPGPGRGRIE